jgi:quercetin dioxygenase-like cupin family protein
MVPRSGDAYVAPDDLLVRFLVTGEETGGAYFAMEAYVPPGAGRQPHTHEGEDETFYVVSGNVEFQLDDDVVKAGPGDFISIPRGQVHGFRNASQTVARMIATFTPAGIESHFAETAEPVASIAIG